MPLGVVLRAVWSHLAQACIILQTKDFILFYFIATLNFIGHPEEFGFFEGTLDGCVLLIVAVIRLSDELDLD